MTLRSLEDLPDKKKNGKWTINDRHEIRYSTDAGTESASFRATLLDVKPAALVLEYTQKESESRTVTRTYELNGTWRVDSKNRIAFAVRKDTGKSDVLTFKNVWTINADHQIEYTFEETAGRRAKKTARRLVFTGFWDISEKSRITYWLGKGPDSYFRFRGAFQTDSILAKKAEIRYQIGVEFQKGIRTQSVVLFGKWKYSRRYGLSFEVEYKDGRKRAIRFGAAEWNPRDGDRLSLNLTNIQGKPLGIELLLTRDFLKGDGEAFLKWGRSAVESRVEGGVSLRW